VSHICEEKILTHHAVRLNCPLRQCGSCSLTTVWLCRAGHSLVLQQP